MTTNVTTAWNDLDAARQTIVSTREQVQANQLAFAGAEQERDVGLRTTIEVLNAQQELLDFARSGGAGRARRLRRRA